MRKTLYSIVLQGCGKITKRTFSIINVGLLQKFARTTGCGQSTCAIAIGLRGKYCAGKFPKIFRRARFERKTLLYRKILLTSSGSIYVLIRRKGAARHRISCLRYTAGSRWQRRRANWEFRKPRHTAFFAVLPLTFIAANVREDEAYSKVAPRGAHFAPPAGLVILFSIHMFGKEFVQILQGFCVARAYFVGYVF